MLQSNALVVDTSTSIRDYIREILHQELGFNEIHEANDADEALQMLKSGCVINWVFSSLEMPGLSTYDLMGHVHNDPSRKHTRFVLMSSNNKHITREAAIRKGAADFLHKPFVPDQLTNMVHRLNGLAEQRRIKRLKVAVPCEINIGFDSFHHYGAELVDISTDGCRVKTSNIKPGSGHVDDYATITLQPGNGEPLHVQSKIKRVEFCKSCADPLLNTEIAIEFVNADPVLKEQLESFIDSCKGKFFARGQTLASASGAC